MVDVLELASNFSVINQQNRTGPFVNGDSFTFGSVVQEAAVTKTLQLNIYGSNTLGQPIVNYFAISFTNDCDVYPVFGDDDFAGWVMFVSAPASVFLSKKKKHAYFFILCPITYLPSLLQTNFEPPPRSACPAVPFDTPTSAYEPSTPSPTPEKTPDSDAPATSPVTPSPTSGSFETESPTSMSMSMSMNYDYTFATLSEFGRSYIIKNSKKASKKVSKRSGSASESGDDESRNSKRRR